MVYRLVRAESSKTEANTRAMGLASDYEPLIKEILHIKINDTSHFQDHQREIEEILSKYGRTMEDLKSYGKPIIEVLIGSRVSWCVQTKSNLDNPHYDLDREETMRRVLDELHNISREIEVFKLYGLIDDDGINSFKPAVLSLLPRTMKKGYAAAFESASNAFGLPEDEVKQIVMLGLKALMDRSLLADFCIVVDEFKIKRTEIDGSLIQKAIKLIEARVEARVDNGSIEEASKAVLALQLVRHDFGGSFIQRAINRAKENVNRGDVGFAVRVVSTFQLTSDDFEKSVTQNVINKIKEQVNMGSMAFASKIFSAFKLKRSDFGEYEASVIRNVVHNVKASVDRGDIALASDVVSAFQLDRYTDLEDEVSVIQKVTENVVVLMEKQPAEAARISSAFGILPDEIDDERAKGFQDIVIALIPRPTAANNSAEPKHNLLSRIRQLRQRFTK